MSDASVLLSVLLGLSLYYRVPISLGPHASLMSKVSINNRTRTFAYAETPNGDLSASPMRVFQTTNSTPRFYGFESPSLKLSPNSWQVQLYGPDLTVFTPRNLWRMKNRTGFYGLRLPTTGWDHWRFACTEGTGLPDRDGSQRRSRGSCFW